MKNLLKKQKGITLIALILTIVILLILAVVTINSIQGDGIIGKAQRAKTDYEKAAEEEQGMLAEFQEIMSSLYGGSSSDEEKTGEENSGDNGSTGGNSNSGDDSSSGGEDSGNNSGDNSGNNSSSGENSDDNNKVNISKTEAYVGYYADIDADGTVDGVIYADLAIGNTTDATSYTINKIEDVKEYYISQKSYSGAFGTKDVLCSTGSGNDRFYVMAIKKLSGGSYSGGYTWYAAQPTSGGMMDYRTATSEDFGRGKNNTEMMIEKWNNQEYGIQDYYVSESGVGYRDLWGQIPTQQIEQGWFVPSKGEWDAFRQELGITKENFNGWYWSSSQASYTEVWQLATSSTGYYAFFKVSPSSNHTSVRLSIIF